MPCTLSTLKQLGIFLWNVILCFTITHNICMKLVKYNEYSISPVDTDGLVLYQLPQSWVHTYVFPDVYGFNLQVPVSYIQPWFKWWLVTFSVPSLFSNQHWLNVCWILWNKSQWHLQQQIMIFIKEYFGKCLHCGSHFAQTWMCVNSLWPSDAIWWQRYVPCGTKPLPEPMLTSH